MRIKRKQKFHAKVFHSIATTDIAMGMTI